MANLGSKPGFLPASVVSSAFQLSSSAPAIQLDTAVSYFAVCVNACSAKFFRCAKVVPPKVVASMISL